MILKLFENKKEVDAFKIMREVVRLIGQKSYYDGSNKSSKSYEIYLHDI